MPDPYHDESLDPYDADIDYVYDDYEDDAYYDDEWEYDYDDHPRNYRRDEVYYPNGVIEIEDYYEELPEETPFWTRRRIIIAIIVIIMITAFLAPTALQIMRAVGGVESSAPIGPTPTALPSI